MERLCLDCGNIINGRIDKKFCNDVCRTNYNNAFKLEDGHFLKQINQILKRNRKILKDRYPNEQVKVKLHDLVKKGFDFDFHTHRMTTNNGQTYFFCYEYGYAVLPSGELMVIKRESNYR